MCAQCRMCVCEYVCKTDLQSKDRGMYGIGQVADDENVVKLLAKVAVRGVDVGK